MTAQVIANPPGSITTYGPDGRIPVEAGVVYRIVDLDSSGVAGPVLDPLALTREIVGEDLQVTLPDGTVLTFEGMLTVLAEGAGGGLAGPDGELAIASLEALVAPAEGAQAQGDTGQGEADDGSSQAFNQAQITDPRQFGEAGEGPFNGLGLPGFSLLEQNEDNPLLLAESLAAEDGPAVPTAGNDTVITADDGRIIVLGRALLANDSGTGLQITSVQDYTGPGTVSVDANGNIVIEQVTGNPAADNSGTTQTLTYTVQDANGNTATAQVLIFVDEFRSVNGEINGPGDLPNTGSEIYIPEQPVNPNNPAGTETFFGGDGDDFFQIRDEQDFRAFGGQGFDTLLVDVEFSSLFMDFHLPRVFSQANNSIEAIDASTADGLGAPFTGVVRLVSQGANAADDWDFSDIALTGVDQINGGGGSDTIVGSAGDDTINGGAGNDTINGWAGNDVIDIGADPANSERVIISDRDHGTDTIINFDNVVGAQDILDLEALFDDLAADLGVALDSAARAGRVSVVQDGADTNVFIDQSAAGNGSDVVQIAIVQGTTATNFDIGAAGTDDIFVGA